MKPELLREALEPSGALYEPRIVLNPTTAENPSVMIDLMAQDYSAQIVQILENTVKLSSKSEHDISPNQKNQDLNDLKEYLERRLKRESLVSMTNRIFNVDAEERFPQLRDIGMTLKDAADSLLATILQHHAANTDPLTGIKNRRAIREFYKTLTHSLEGKRTMKGIIRVDMDNFGAYNKEPYNYQIGDLLLKLQSKAFDRALRGNNQSIGRYGGDEFVIVLSEIPQKKKNQIARQIFIDASGFFKELVCADPKIPQSIKDNIPTFSAGAAFIADTDMREFDDLDSLAARLQLKAKKRGKNQIITES